MGNAGRLLGGVMLLSIVLSIGGLNSIAGPVALLVLLVGILGLATGGLRPSREGGSLHARGLPFLGRYSGLDGTALPAAFVAGFASAEILGILAKDSYREEMVALAVFAFVGFLLHREVASAFVGIAGTMALIASFLGASGHCRDDVSTAALGVFVGVLGAGVLAAVLLRLPLSFIPRPLAQRRATGSWVLALFGVAEVAAFAAQPVGVEIWSSATSEYRLVFGVLVIVVAVFGSYAPDLSLGLVALGLATASLYFVAVQLPVSGVVTCSNAEEQLGAAVVCGAAILGAAIVRPRGILRT